MAKLEPIEDRRDCDSNGERDPRRKSNCKKLTLVVALYDVHPAIGEGVKVRRRVPGEGRVSGLEAKSSEIRVAPSPGVQQSSNGILGRAARRSSRIDKEGREHCGRDSPNRSSKGLSM